MDIEKIEKFIDAGYTKAEIEALSSEGNEAKSEGAEPEESKGQGAADTAHDSAVDTAEMLKTLTSTVEGLTNTVKALQAANIKNANSGTSKPVDAIKETMDSFLKDL